MPDAAKKYDVLLKAGHVICPASGIDGHHDVAIRGGRIAAIEATILPSSAAEIINVAGKLVLPGLIDTHAHVYQYVTGRFGLNPDMVGVRSGVTTLIDQGGPSCMTLPGFRHFVVEPAATQVLAFLSAYLVGGDRGPLLPQSLQPRRRRYRRRGGGGQCQQGHRARYQGPRRDRRLRARLGALKPGYAADVSVLYDDRGRFILRDNEDNRVIAERLLRPAFCLRAGKRYDADSPILPQVIAA